MTKRPTPRLNQSEACSCQLNTRSESGKLLNAWLVEMGVPPDVAVDDDAIQLLHAKCLAGGLNPWVRSARRESVAPLWICFPARGLPQSGSKGLSQPFRRTAPLANVF
jgi:hypothetical protein